jgi:hypothetical protein
MVGVRLAEPRFGGARGKQAGYGRANVQGNAPHYIHGVRAISGIGMGYRHGGDACPWDWQDGQPNENGERS